MKSRVKTANVTVQFVDRIALNDVRHCLACLWSGTVTMFIFKRS